jgi:S-formylglutathione hydrolase FrmB
MAKLQRSRKEEEQRRKKNLPKLVRWQCNGGKHADGDPISPAMSGKGVATVASRAKMSDDGEDAGVKEDDGGGAGFPVRWFRRRRARGGREHRKKEWGVKR